MNKLKTQNDEFEKLLTQAGKSCDDFFPAAKIGDALNNMILAKEYEDETLIDSAFTAAMDAFARMAEFFVDRAAGIPQVASAALEEGLEKLEGKPFENLDILGNKVRSKFDESITRMTDLRENLVGLLLQEGHEVKNAPKLDAAIEEMRNLRDEFFKDWPWATRQRPPVNRKMIAESRAAIERGEGESVRDMIHKLDRESSN
jgi:hypothetical protein